MKITNRANLTVLVRGRGGGWVQNDGGGGKTSYYSWQGRDQITLHSRYQIIVCNHSHFQFADLLSRGQGVLLAKTQDRRMNLFIQHKYFQRMSLSWCSYYLCRIVLFSHNIAMVITITQPRKTGGLLTKDDVDFADAGYWLVTSLQQPGGSTLSPALHFNCENLHKKCNLLRIHMLWMIMSSRGGDQTLALWHKPCNFVSFPAFLLRQT